MIQAKDLYKLKALGTIACMPGISGLVCKSIIYDIEKEAIYTQACIYICNIFVQAKFLYTS